MSWVTKLCIREDMEDPPSIRARPKSVTSVWTGAVLW